MKKDKRIDTSVADHSVKDSKKIKNIGNDIAFDVMDALSSPIITFEISWADRIPERIKSIIPSARLKALLKKAEEATDPEIAAYLYTRSLIAPMDSNWTDIYTYITCKVIEDWYNEDFWAITSAPRKLSSDNERELTRLRRSIYESRRKVLKSRMSGKSKSH